MALGSLDYATAPCCFLVKKSRSFALFKKKNNNSIKYRRHSCISLSLAVAPTERRVKDSLEGHAHRTSAFRDDAEEGRKGKDIQIALRENDDNNATSSTSSSSVKLSSNGSASKSKGRDLDGATSPISDDPMSEASVEIDQREKVRRERIGLANKGKTPWNKGKNHSPETIARMRERNRIVMRDPKIRDKLRQYSRPQSQETREKLRIIMQARMEFERRQMTVLQEWKDSIAEAARVGDGGDDELQWGSYGNIKEKLRQQYFASKKKKILKEKPPRTWTFEQRLRISESVSAKWADPEYREKVISRIHDTRQKRRSVKRVQQKLADEEFDKVLAMLASSPGDELGSVFTKVGSYNDPLAEEKLKKIKMRRVQKNESSIDRGIGVTGLDLRAQPNDIETSSAPHGGRTTRLAAFQKAQQEATEKARLLLAEAERAAVLAAQALDASGAHDESLSNSLLEAWALLDEASKSILGTEVGSSFPS